MNGVCVRAGHCWTQISSLPGRISSHQVWPYPNLTWPLPDQVPNHIPVKKRIDYWYQKKNVHTWSPRAKKLPSTCTTPHYGWISSSWSRKKTSEMPPWQFYIESVGLGLGLPYEIFMSRDAKGSSLSNAPTRRISSHTLLSHGIHLSQNLLGSPSQRLPEHCHYWQSMETSTSRSAKNNCQEYSLSNMLLEQSVAWAICCWPAILRTKWTWTGHAWSSCVQSIAFYLCWSWMQSKGKSWPSESCCGSRNFAQNCGK